MPVDEITPRELRRLPPLSTPAALCEALQLTDGARKRGNGMVMIRCPWHEDRDPSCSVSVGKDGTVMVRCFSCQATADALGLVEQVYGCRSFADTLEQAKRLAGIMDQPSNGTAKPPVRHAEPVSRPEPRYPWSSDVERFWSSLGPVARHPTVAGVLRRRSIDPGLVDACHLAGAINGKTWLPDWARYRGDADSPRPWAETGHLLVLPVFDHEATMRSVRAWRVFESDDAPKRLPPAGHKASGLVLANMLALQLLRGETGPTRIVIAEGEPSFLTAATRYDCPTIGVLSGAWNDNFAEKIPVGSTLILRTDRDPAGDKYAAQIAKSCAGKCQIRRVTA